MMNGEQMMMMKVDYSKPRRKHFGNHLINSSSISSSSFSPSQKTMGVEAQEIQETVDLSAMSLDTLPITSNLNLAMVRVLDISNNNLEVYVYGF